MPSARILVLSFSPVASDPRVRRQIDLLKTEYGLTVAGYGPYEDSRVEFISLTRSPRSFRQRLSAVFRLLLRNFNTHYWSSPAVAQVRAALRGRRFDLIIANDADTWPLALDLRASGGGRVLCDAHEYAPREFEDRLYWRILYQAYRTWLCRRCLPQADGMTTVCDGIADEYVRIFGVPRPLVVPNTPAAQPGEPAPTPADRIRLIHHGLASRSRRIEVMIDLMTHLDARFTLDLMLVSSEPGYLQSLRERAAGNPRIRFRDPVITAAIIAETRAYDLGLFLLPPTNFNYRFALPNKFFEFIQARLAVAIGPSPEMAHLVREYDCGVVADDFTPEALAAALRPVTAAQVDGWKKNSHRAATELCWDRKSEILRHEIKRLLALTPCAA